MKGRCLFRAKLLRFLGGLPSHRWASEAMYEGRLVPADGVGERRVENLIDRHAATPEEKHTLDEANPQDVESASAPDSPLSPDSPDAPDGDDEDLTNAVMLFLDTAGCDFEERVTLQPRWGTAASGTRSDGSILTHSRTSQVVGEGSHLNEREGCVAVQHVLALLHRGLQPEDICMITPYNGQVPHQRSDRVK
eukprot:scaffold495_cov243-Pinguiococcus_pyrenoidosus.AAC.9